MASLAHQECPLVRGLFDFLVRRFFFLLYHFNFPCHFCPATQQEVFYRGSGIFYQDKDKGENLLSIDVKDLGDEFQITIEDNGLGISENHLDKVYEMFYRASTDTQGSGLGLYIVKESVAKLQGQILLESEEGKYTKFTVSLPNRKKNTERDDQ